MYEYLRDFDVIQRERKKTMREVSSYLGEVDRLNKEEFALAISVGIKEFTEDEITLIKL
ncbi:MAG: hypothetical protein ABDH49_08050 [Candidatus Hydrothermales bacterium]